MSRTMKLFSILTTFTMAGAARADLTPEWITRLPVGSSLYAGIAGMVVDPAGVSYVTGIRGPSSNTDILTAAIAPDGSLLWSHVFNGPQNSYDQARGITLSPGGSVFVTGNTAGQGSYANVLVLEYDAASGALLNTIQYSSGPFTSEHGASVATDALGDIYVAGGTVGDGADAMILKFDAAGTFQWKRTWDGPAAAPYSQDHALEVLVDANGDPLVLIHGVMASLHPDYVVLKYAAGDGALLWQAVWGLNGEDQPRDMEIDATGDVYVTGTGLDFNDKLSTIKLRGTDGGLLWQAYDHAGIDDRGRAVTLDGQGGVYITGSVDFDGDESNFNDDIYTVKRDAAGGALVWTHLYGAPCIGCFDVPSDVVVDASGHVFVGGATSSPPYSADMITLVLDTGTGAETERGVISGAPAETAGVGIMELDAGSDLLEGGRFYDANTGAVDISIVKYRRIDPTYTSYCTSAPNSMGAGAVIGASGSTSVSGNDFTLDVTAAAASQVGLFYYGPNQIEIPFGNGYRCVGGGAFRLGPPLSTDPAGFATRWLDFTQPPANGGPGAILAGSHWNFQFWYRDPAAGGASFNLSDGLSVDFLP